MRQLEELVSRCKAEVCLTFNPHTVNYESAEKHLKRVNASDDAEEETIKMMISRNRIIRLDFYPRTPVGSYTVYHHDLECCLDIALEVLDLEEKL